MESKRIAFQGELGAYSEEALLVAYPDAVPLPEREFRDVARAVLEGRAELGLLPIENSLVGSIATNFDLIAESGLAVVGEVVSAVRHCLLGVPGAATGAVRRVLSHPVALAQCERFLGRLAGVEVVAFYDTAGAAAEVARRADPALAAVAGRLAARRYGLAVLAEGIEGEPHNQTRFLFVARARAAPPAGVAAKTTLRLKLPHRPGTRARGVRRGGAEPDQAREPPRSHDALGVSVLSGCGRARGRPGDGAGARGARRAGRRGERARRLSALHAAARLTAARQPKYTGTPASTHSRPRPLYVGFTASSAAAIAPVRAR